MRPFTIFAAIVAFAACTQAAPPDPACCGSPDAPARLFLPGTRTLLVGEAATGLTHQCSRISPGPIEAAWIPPDIALDALEQELAPALAAALQGTSRASADVTDYYRQYAGITIGGRNIVYINGVHRDAIEREPNPDHPFDWRTQATGICDGGAITFGAEYDVETHEIRNFAFNGAFGGTP